MADKKENPMHRLFDEIQMDMDQLFSEIQTELSSDEWMQSKLSHPSELSHYAHEATKWFHEKYPNKSELELKTWLLEVGWGLGQRIDRADSSLNNQTVSDFEIETAMIVTDGNKTNVGKKLGMTRQAVNRRLKDIEERKKKKQK